jgi:hypothetical protein
VFAVVYNQINRVGVSKTVGGVQVYGDGLVRARSRASTGSAQR